MKKLGIGLGVVVGVLLTYVLVHVALIEIGQEVVVLHKWKGEGEMSLSRLWIVGDGEHEWLHHADADSPWIHRLDVDRILVIDRDGAAHRYRAFPDPEAEAKVHRMLREKYGVADVLVRFWVGTDTETGFATGEMCPAIPVRLEAIEPGA
jgi:hypothetical protein